MGLGLYLVIREQSQIVAVYRFVFREYGAFDVVDAFASQSELDCALMNDTVPIATFKIPAPHPIGCLRGDVLNVDQTMCSMIANKLHDAIEAGALIGQEFLDEVMVKL